jgi:signal transduction histidine kinase
MLLGLLLFASPLPSFNEAAHLDLAAISGIGGLPLLLIAFPLYIVFCTVLSLDALRHPTPAVRLMGDQARRRARPWLVAATSLLLLVSFLVSAVIVWLMLYGQPALADGRVVLLNRAVGWFDLIIETLILGAVIMVGQAIVSYEIFTGRTLPRSEFRRSWQYAIILAVGLGLAVGLSFALQARPIYTLLLVTLLLVVFYALLGWRSYTRREEYVRQLRPFLVSQRLYERLARIPLAGAEPAAAGRMAPEADSASLFRVLCEEILGIRFAHLVAVGPLAPLVGAPLTYPLHRTSSAPSLDALISQCHSPDNVCLPLDPERWQGLQWAVPLWNERGLIGLFLLGPKIDDGLFTQEEMEIVQVSGERLIDAQASGELSRSLMALQRQRLVESQLLDRHTRRILHDEILPQIHSALLIVSSGDAQSIDETTALLAGVHRELADLLREMPARGAPPVVGQGLLVALRQLLADELKDAFDDVKWNIEPQAAERLAKMPALTVEVLFYAAREAIRNAARYGRGDDSNRSLCLCIAASANPQLALCIEDNGVGLQREDEPQSSGQGLALHSAMLAVVGGTLAVASKPHVYTRVTLMLF